MIKEGFGKFFWGFLFIMFDFRIQGIDILPNVIGFILFAIGFQALSAHSQYFTKGKGFNFIMIILSTFSIYEQPAQGEGVHVHPVGMLVGTASLLLTLVVVYHLLMGVKDMAHQQQRSNMENEASQNWTYFLVFQIAVLLNFILIFIPPLFIVTVIVLFVVSIVLMIKLMRFMKTCGEQLSKTT